MPIRAAAPVLGVPSVVLAGGAVGGRDGAAPARRPAVELRQLVRLWHFLVGRLHDLSITRATHVLQLLPLRPRRALPVRPAVISARGICFCELGP